MLLLAQTSSSFLCPPSSPPSQPLISDFCDSMLADSTLMMISSGLKESINELAQVVVKVWVSSIDAAVMISRSVEETINKLAQVIMEIWISSIDAAVVIASSFKQAINEFA